MEAYEMLKELDTVRAPAGFEQKVMAQLSLRKRRQLHSRTLRLSIGGALAGGIAVLLILNFFILPHQGPVRMAALENQSGTNSVSFEGVAPGDILPITETVDYATEVRTLTNEVPTVYILEHVSGTTDTKIIY